MRYRPLKRLSPAAWSLILVALACAPVKVTTSTTPGADFSAYQTYAIVPPPESRDSVRAILEKEITQELDQRGYKSATLGQSDLLIVAQAKAMKARRHVFAQSPGGCCIVQEYLAGTLLVEAFDAQSGKRLWSGVGEVDLENESDKEVDAAADKAVRAVLKKFPSRDG